LCHFVTSLLYLLISLLKEVSEIGLEWAHRLYLLSQAIVVVLQESRTSMLHCMLLYFIKSNDNNIHDQVHSLVMFDSHKNTHKKTIGIHVTWINSQTIFVFLTKTLKNISMDDLYLFELIFRMRVEKWLNYILIFSCVDWTGGIWYSQRLECGSMVEQRELEFMQFLHSISLFLVEFIIFTNTERLEIFILVTFFMLLFHVWVSGEVGEHSWTWTTRIQ